MGSRQFRITVNAAAPSAERLVLSAAGQDNAIIRLGPFQDRRVLVPEGAVWKYLDDGSDQQSHWRDADFNDSDWKAGPAQLGYGDSDEKTIVGFGPDESKSTPPHISGVISTCPILRTFAYFNCTY